METIINLDGKTRIRRVDPANWTVEVLKDRKRKDGAAYTEWTQANGDKFGPFLKTPMGCVSWLLDRRFGDSGFQGGLKEALAEYGRIMRELSEAVSKACA